VAVDPVQECREIDQQVARINELEVEEFFLARHGVSLSMILENPILKNQKMDRGLPEGWGL
jgi:hypothetical protein